MNHKAERQAEILGHTGKGYTEYRNIGQDKFIGINPRKTLTGTTNEDVACITCIVVDIDTEDEKSALDLARTIAFAENYKSHVLVASGRGAHLYVPVHLPITFNLKAYYQYLQNTYKKDGCKIDSIHDLARVIRRIGSINSKNGKECRIIEDNYNGINANIEPKESAPVHKSGAAEPAVYTNGSRNQTLASLAGSMRRRGFSKEAIETALLEENHKCQPPLDEQEVLRIAQSIARYQPSSVEQKTVGINIDNSYFDGLSKRQPGIYSGFSRLDSMTGGIKSGHLWIIAGRPGQGKTTFCVDLAKRYAKQGKSVLYFSTEMGASSLYDKIVSSETGVSLRKFLVGGFDDLEINRINQHKENIQMLPIKIYEAFSLTTIDVEKAIKEVAPEIVIIDQLQSFKYAEGGKSQEQAAVVQKVRQLSSDYGLKIILANQLNRQAEASTLSLGNLKGTGTGEELADLVMFLVAVDKESSPRPVDIHIMKARYGCVGMIKSLFHVENGSFEEI